MAGGAREAAEGGAAESWIRIGVVTRPHGVRGAVRLHLDNPHSDLLAEGLPVRLHLEGERPRELTTEVARVFGGGDRVELDALAGRDQAEAWRGALLEVRREDFPPAADDETYLVDLIGAHVTDEAGQPLGTLEAFSDNGAQPLAHVRQPDGRVVEVPFVPPLVADVDLEAGQVVLRPPEGLFWGEPEVADDRPAQKRRKPGGKRGAS